jgi:hypothetical protein
MKWFELIVHITCLFSFTLLVMAGHPWAALLPTVIMLFSQLYIHPLSK